MRSSLLPSASWLISSSGTEARRERNSLIPTAEAKANQLIREAEGYAARRRAESKGEIAALRAKYQSYKEAPEPTRRRMYLETMERVLNRTDKLILDNDSGAVPYLPLDRVNRGGN